MGIAEDPYAGDFAFILGLPWSLLLEGVAASLWLAIVLVMLGMAINVLIILWFGRRRSVPTRALGAPLSPGRAAAACHRLAYGDVCRQHSSDKHASVHLRFSFRSRNERDPRRKCLHPATNVACYECSR